MRLAHRLAACKALASVLSPGQRMIRDLLTILLTLTLALGLGIWSAREATARYPKFGALQIGVWKAYPTVGTEESDPYLRAKVARESIFVLGSAEGLEFIAETDSAGDRLSSSCDYIIEGRVTNARLWTLQTSDKPRSLNQNETIRGISNSHIVSYRPDGTFTLRLAKRIKPGDWAPLNEEGPFNLVLTAYDSAIASSTGIATPELPEIRAEDCSDE